MADTAKKPNIFVRAGRSVVRFLRDVKGEVKKVVWPSPKSVFRHTGVVLAMIIVVGIFLFCLDTAFLSLLGLVMGVSN